MDRDGLPKMSSDVTIPGSLCLFASISGSVYMFAFVSVCISIRRSMPIPSNLCGRYLYVIQGANLVPGSPAQKT